MRSWAAVVEAGGGMSDNGDQQQRILSWVLWIVLLGAAIGLIALGVRLMLREGVSWASGGVALIAIGCALGYFSNAIASTVLRKR